MQPFVTTVWTMIREAKAGSREALERLLSRYRPPLLSYLLQRGLSEHDAEDLAQEVFLRVCQEDFLRRTEKSKGKFRTLMIRVSEYLLVTEVRKRYSQKRGGGAKAVSLDSFEEVPVSATEEDRFGELWAKHLIQIALDKLKRSSSRGKIPYHDILVQRFLEGKSNQEIARDLGCTEHDVSNYIYIGKERLRRHLMKLARGYSSSAEEYREEMELFKRFSP